jgi:nucleotide-binding universal stress UspA family protein
VAPGAPWLESVRHEVIEGEAAEEIVAAANGDGYDAVVMSTRGAGAFRRWFIIGSVTSKVLDAAERPVITSSHFENHRPPLRLRRVMCAIDLGPQSTRVLCWGKQAARSFGASLDVAHVTPALESATYGEESRTWRSTAHHRLGARMEELKRSLEIETETVIGFGDPARTLSELARQRRADLLVLGRGVSQGLIGRLRANAYDIIRQCPCPVVSI